MCGCSPVRIKVKELLELVIFTMILRAFVDGMVLVSLGAVVNNAFLLN